MLSEGFAHKAYMGISPTLERLFTNFELIKNTLAILLKNNMISSVFQDKILKKLNFTRYETRLKALSYSKETFHYLSGWFGEKWFSSKQNTLMKDCVFLKYEIKNLQKVKKQIQLLQSYFS